MSNPKETDAQRQHRVENESPKERRKRFERNIDTSLLSTRWTWFNSGIGKGKVSFCVKCNTIPRKSHCRDNKWLCGECGSECEQRDRGSSNAK